MPKIVLQNIVDYEERSRKLQAKLLMMFDDEVQSLPKEGFERLMCISRYNAVFGRLWQFFTKQGLVMKDGVQQMGGEVEIAEDVPIEKLQELISIPIAPKRDRNLEGRAPHVVQIERTEPMVRTIDIGTAPIRIGAVDEEPEDDPEPESDDEGEEDTKDEDTDTFR